jgi:PAS domain S-box-containing protein
MPFQDLSPNQLFAELERLQARVQQLEQAETEHIREIEQLHATSTIYRLIAERSSDLIARCSADGICMYVSPVCQSLLGYDTDDLLGCLWYDFIHPQDIVDVITMNQAVLEGSSMRRVTYRMRRKDGQYICLETTGAGVNAHQAGVGREIVSISRKYAENNRAGEAFQAAILPDTLGPPEPRRAAELLRQHNAYLTALHETTLALMNRRDLADLLEFIVTSAGVLVGTQHGLISLIDPERGDAIAKVGIGHCKQLVGQRTKKFQGLSGLVYQTGRPQIVENYPDWSERLSGKVYEAFHAAMAVPLQAREQVIGVLFLVRVQDGRVFEEHEVQQVMQFAELASLAIDSAQLYAAAQKELAQRKRMESELLDLNARLEQRVQERTTELRREQALLTAILDAMGEGLIYVNDAYIYYANQALAQLTGYRVEELIGQPSAMLQCDNASEQEAEFFMQGFAQGELTERPQRGEIRLRRKAGTDFDAALTVSSFIEAGNPLGTVILVRDITAEKQLQEQKTRFIANASHELRTPLTNFTMRLYLLSKQPERLQEHLAVLERITSYMTGLVEDLLDISRFERGVIVLRYQNISLQILLEDIIRLQQPGAENKHIELTAELPEEPITVEADLKRLTQVMINLVVNALNYTPAGGKVTIMLGTQTTGGQSWAVIRVIDTGIGIAPQHLPRLFEPFFRASESSSPGTGLGLPIAREIVEMHQGTLTVESTLGMGSTFTVRLLDTVN